MNCNNRIVRRGVNVGPVDWSHETAKDMPSIWREAEKSPNDFLFSTYGFPCRAILSICMYDGWPYWKPMPAVHYIGALGRAEWAHFNSYGVHKNSIERRTQLSSNDHPSIASSVENPARDLNTVAYYERGSIDPTVEMDAVELAFTRGEINEVEYDARLDELIEIANDSSGASRDYH